MADKPTVLHSTKRLVWQLWWTLGWGLHFEFIFKCQNSGSSWLFFTRGKCIVSNRANQFLFNLWTANLWMWV